MNEREKKRQFQWVKSLSNETFWSWMNDIHTKVYALAMDHMKDAMSCHPRISKPMIADVLRKAEEIRERWDGLKTITVDDTVNQRFLTAEEMIHGLSPTEGMIYKLEKEAVFDIVGRKFLVVPISEEEAIQLNESRRAIQDAD